MMVVKKVVRLAD
jgi:hypothetical protein